MESWSPYFSSSLEVMYVLPDKVGFPSWVYNNYQYPMVQEGELSCDISIKAKKLFPHQEFVRKFLDPKNPYRGLLLYFGLGTGKSCSSIAVADFYTSYNPPVYVILPASLAPNYKKEIVECAEIGLMEREWCTVNIQEPSKKNSKTIANFLKISEKWLSGKTEFVWPQSKTFFKDLPEDVAKVTKGALKELKQDTIECILSEHYHFIHYNGLSKSLLAKLEQNGNPFENRLVVIDEAHNFISQVVNGGSLAKKLYNLLMSAENNKIICLTGTPIINQAYELSFLLNLLRGEIHVYDFFILKNAKTKKGLTEDDILATAKAIGMDDYINDVEVSMAEQRVSITFTPKGFKMNKERKGVIPIAVADMESEDALVSKLHDHFMKNLGIGKTLKKHITYALPMDKNDFNSLFLNTEENTVKNPLLFQHRIQGTVAYFKSTGETLLPSVQKNEIVKCTMSNHQFKIYQTVRDQERKMEGRGGGTGSKVYRAFSRMVCNFAFPEGFKRPYPKDLRKEMDLHDEIALVETVEKGKGKEKEKEVDKENLLKQQQALRLDATLKKLVANAETYLKGPELHNFSPKYVALYDRLNTSPGTSLLYTQFRTMEGIGLFCEVLKARGWQPLDISHTAKGGTWKFTETLLPNTKKYIVFPEDRTKATILLDLFNNRWENVPKELLISLKQQLPDIQNNLRGELVQLLMITQSGAEGLSLRNVRQVHILEPYWNQIRIDQVIGRAVRTCSHQDLPISDRNLSVYTYIACLSASQLKDAYTIRRKDKSLTSDEHILQLAQNKDQITRGFLELMQQSAVDCLVHAAQNRPKKGCFAPPVNAIKTDRMYHPVIGRDLLDYARERLEKTVKVRGKNYMVITLNGKKVVQEIDTGNLYDYQSFKFGYSLVR